MKGINWAAVRRIVNRALAGVNYLLTVAVSTVVIIIAIVLFRTLVDGPDEPQDETGAGITTTTETAPTSTSPPATTSSAATTVTTSGPPDCTAVEPAAGDAIRIIRIFYACGDGVTPTGDTWVYRTVPDDDPLIGSTMTLLVAGPTADERRHGFWSLFSAATADAVIDTSRRRGAVVVDFRSLGPMPSLTSGRDGPFFLAELNNTLFQHDVVDTIEYRIEGSCEDFWAYLGEDECIVVERSQWAESDAAAESL